MRLTVFSVSVLFLLLLSLPAFAGLGKIAGIITDAATGEALPGVNVLVTGTSLGAMTDLQGRYFIINVPPGRYTVKVSIVGYTSQEIQDVLSQLDVTTGLNLALKQTAIAGETVTIVAERPLVDKTMTATKVTFADEQVNNVLPAATLNEILQTSVTVQAMRGATKRGVGYMIDGVNVTDALFAGGPVGGGYSNVKLDDTPTNSSSEVIYTTGGSNAQGTAADLSIVRTSGYQVPQSQVQEANVIAGTVNAEYSASSGVINLATKDGGSNYSAKLFLRSSMGGLNHAGPDLYNARPPADVFAGKTAAEHYFALRDKLLASTDPANLARGKLMDWVQGKYEYGDDPRMNAELYVGGPLTSKGNFFVSAQVLNDHGRFPGEFQRQVTGSLKLNYYVTPSNRLTLMSKVDDGGKLGGWVNRQFTYMYMFFLEGQPVNQKLATTNYLKWIKTFNPSSFLETMVSYVTSRRTWGYRPVEGKLKYGEYGDEWLILDTKEKVKQYIVDTGTRIFTANPGNDQYFQVDDFGNQIRFGKPGYLYEDVGTDVLNVKTDFTKQINFNHQLKAGAEYNATNLDFTMYAASATGMDANFPYDTDWWNRKPWNFGSYIQDRIEFQGIIVNAGLRFDGYSYNWEIPNNLFNPLQLDTLSNGQMVYTLRQEKSVKAHAYFSPRLGVSHPITDNAAMHYSWGIYTTPQTPISNYNRTIYNYVSLPGYTSGDLDPERATAYEIGTNVAFTKDLSADITAYYRDTRNAGTTSYVITLPKSSGSGLGYPAFSWGYRDSRGFELNMYKRPTAERYFGVVGLSGNWSLAFSYDKPSSAANSLVTDQSARNNLASGTTDEVWNFDLRYLWPTYSRGFNYWRSKLTLLFDFPMGFKLSTLTSYNNAPYFVKQLNVKNLRYEEYFRGDDFFQTDVRLMKYFTLGKYKAALFVEALNAFDRENVLTFDTYIYNTMYEKDRIPWGPFWRPTDGAGIPFTGIARELYAGIEFSF